MKKPEWNKWVKDKEDCKGWLDSYTYKKIIIKSKKESDFYFKKSIHNLNFANWNLEKQQELKKLFNENFYDWVVVVYYYSIYHASLALLSELGYKSKSHLATLCFITYYYFHNKNLLEKEHIELIAESIEKEDIKTIAISESLRGGASYNVHETFERELVNEIKNEAIGFIKNCQNTANFSPQIFIEKVRTILNI